MLFNSLTFAVFLAVVLGLHNLALPWNVKKLNLLVASYIFYAAWSPPFVILLWISTVVDWKAAGWIGNAPGQARRRLILCLSLIANLGFLGYFKYGGFLLENFTHAMHALGVRYTPPKGDITLPVGISFYTFQSIAYSLDVYLRRAQPTASLLDFALFVTFFPHLVAGPIVRPATLIPQFETPRRASRDQLVWGLALVTLGLFEKVALADGFLAPVADTVHASPRELAALDAWTGALAFSGQIFCDFSGYSTTAIGVALMLGFALNDNFNFPYAAAGFSDFWLGAAVAVSGRFAAIGIPYDTELAPGAGRVGIYRKTSEGWLRSATLAPSDAEDIHFGRDVDLCGSLMVVAAEHSIYAFQFRSARWREVQRIPLASREKVLGQLVCSNESFAFSLMGTDQQGQPVGKVHVFERQRGGHFRRVARLRASDPNAAIGRSLAMEHGVLVVGAEPDAVYVFVRHGHRWIERQRLQSTGQVNADVGAAVAIRDRIIIAGAPEGEVSLFSEGDAFVYLPYRGRRRASRELTGSIWVGAISRRQGSGSRKDFEST